MNKNKTNNIDGFRLFLTSIKILNLNKKGTSSCGGGTSSCGGGTSSCGGILEIKF